jgi:hypothetical protein
MEKAFENIEVPWGFIPGYHDYEADKSITFTGIYNQFVKMKRNVIEVSNLGKDYDYFGEPMKHMLTYNIPIFSSDLKTEVSRIWFFENGRWECMG